MNWGPVRFLALWLAAVFGLAAQPAFAETFAPGSAFPPGSVCHATADAHEDYATLAAQPARWNCTGRDWSIAGAHTFLRLDLRGADRVPTALTTRLTRFRSMRITALAADGREASRDLTEAGMTPSTSDWLMSTSLPRLGAPTEAVVLRIEGARHIGMLADTKLTSGPLDNPAGIREELLVAMLCGMLFMPLVFNFAFFRVLRERFLLWHVASTGCMLVHTFVTSGLVNRFVSLSLGELSVASAVTVGGAIIAASAFSADLIEPDKLDPIHRRLLHGIGIWVPGWTLFYLFAGGPLLPYVAPVYLASFLPPMALFIWTMGVAWRRGSRAVNFQIAAWAPVMLTAAIRIVSALGATDAPIEMLIGQHYAMGLEVLITSLGVMDRLSAIRGERDVALAEIRIIAERSERDHLTGLYNRGAVEQRFARMHANGGFHTMALIDLDKFKQVNDTFGHIIGDAVLQAVAQALEPDGDTVAVRIGGEEFMLLLRGKDAAARAERRRQAIPARIAAEVPGLDRVVTASMGLVELPADGAVRADFSTLYGHCDRLLYEAKHAGRNRTMREKMQSFGPGKLVRAA